MVEQQELDDFVYNLPPTTGVITETVVDETATSGIGTVKVRDIPLSQIQFDANQPRDDVDEAGLNDLARSIEINGLLHWPVVRETGIPEVYVVEVGERRIRACAQLGMNEVRCRVMPAIPPEEEEDYQEKLLTKQVAENYARSDLKPAEVIKAFDRLEDRGIPSSVAGENFGMALSTRYVYDRVRGDEISRSKVLDGSWSLNRAIAYLKSEVQRKETTKDVQEEESAELQAAEHEAADHEAAEHEAAEHEVEEHEAAEHEAAEHEVEEHEAADHEAAEHEAEEHEAAEHEVEEHEAAEHEVEEHEAAEHEAADHEAAEHEAADHEAETAAAPDVPQPSEEPAPLTATAPSQQPQPGYTPTVSPDRPDHERLLIAVENLVDELERTNEPARLAAQGVIFRSSGVITCADWLVELFEDATPEERVRVMERLAQLEPIMLVQQQ